MANFASINWTKLGRWTFARTKFHNRRRTVVLIPPTPQTGWPYSSHISLSVVCIVPLSLPEEVADTMISYLPFVCCVNFFFFLFFLDHVLDNGANDRPIVTPMKLAKKTSKWKKSCEENWWIGSNQTFLILEKCDVSKD